MTNTDDLKKEFDKDLAQLQTIRDEIRLKLHLAGMEMKDQWAKLEPNLADLEHAAGKFTEVSRAALSDALARVRAFRDALNPDKPST